MARQPRFCPPGLPQHVIQRGNNRQVCFNADEDMAAYAHWLHDSAVRYRVAIHAWVFMTNHVHLLLTPETANGLSCLMQSLGRQYVRRYNKTYRRSGTLWEGRFKSCLVQTEVYLLQCQRYIELNPVRAGMVQDPSEYPWFSYRCHALGMESRLLTPHAEYLRLGQTAAERQVVYRDLFRHHLDEAALTDIRESANCGLAFGSERFKDEIEANLNRRVRRLPAGRRPRVIENAGVADDPGLLVGDVVGLAVYGDQQAATVSGQYRAAWSTFLFLSA